MAVALGGDGSGGFGRRRPGEFPIRTGSPALTRLAEVFTKFRECIQFLSQYDHFSLKFIHFLLKFLHFSVKCVWRGRGEGRGQRSEIGGGGWEELVGVSCQGWFGRAWSGACYWVPAFAGMTGVVLGPG